MSLWIGNREVGLSTGQSSGEVNNEFLERPASVSTTGAYIPRITTEVKVERDSSGKPTRFNLYRSDQFGNLLSFGEQRAGRGNPIITTPISRISQEQAERFNVFQEKEYQQDVRLAYERQQQTAARKQVQSLNLFNTPKYTPTGRLLQPSKRLPYTPIQKQTPAAYGLYMKPFYDYSANLSQGLQYKYALSVEKTKTPRPFKQFMKGAGTSITGLPEFFGSGAAGIEYGVRHPKEVKEKIIPAVSSYAGGFVKLAIKDPFYATGQLAGVLALGKASKIKTSSLMKETSASLSLMPRSKPFPRQIPQLQFKKRPAYTHEIFYEEPIVKIRAGENILNNIRDYARTRKPILTTIAGSKYKYGVGIFTPQRIGVSPGSSIKTPTRNIMFQGLSIGQIPQISYGNIYRTAYGTGLSNLMRVDLVTPQLTKLKSIQDLMTVQKTKVREPYFRRPKPIKIEMPSFESPDIFGMRKRRKEFVKSKTITTRMLSLKDLLRNI